MIRDVEKNPVAVSEIRALGHTPTSSLTVWSPSMMGMLPTSLHTPGDMREDRGEGGEKRYVCEHSLSKATCHWSCNSRF